MAFTVVTVPAKGANIVLKNHMTVDLVHTLASAFVTGFDVTNAVTSVLRSILQPPETYLRYAIDMSGVIWSLTFSLEDSPRTLSYHGRVARVCSPAWEVHLRDADVLRVPRFVRGPRPYHLTDT